MKKISGAQLTFTPAGIAHFNDGQLKAFYIFSHISNKLRLLQAQIFSHFNKATAPSLPKPVQDAALFGLMESFVLLAGELKEAWEAVQQCYYATQLSKDMNSALPEEVQQALKRVPSHFKGDALTALLRNDFAFHHSPDRVLATAKLLQSDDPHVAYLFEDDNNYFDFATKLRIAAIAEVLGLSDWNKVVERLVQVLVGQVLNDMYMILNAILVGLFESVPHAHETLSLSNVVNVDQLSSEFFFESSRKQP